MKQRDAALDFVRLVAAVMIVVFHFNSMFAPTGDVSAGPLRYANGSFGNFGVALFFLLSGYALMLRYGQACPLKTFYKKRFLSIYPLYWLCFFSLFLYSDILHGNLPAGVPGWSIIWSVLALDGYLAGVVPTFYLLGEWFVGCIVLLYLVFPLLRAALLRAVRPAVCVTLALWAVWLAFYPGPFAREHDFITCIPIFMAGMVLAHTRAACACLAGAPGGAPRAGAGAVGGRGRGGAGAFCAPAFAAGGVRPFAGRGRVFAAARPGPRAAKRGIPRYPASGGRGLCCVSHPPCAVVYCVPAAGGAAAHAAAGVFAVRRIPCGHVFRGHFAQHGVGPRAGVLAVARQAARHLTSGRK